MAFQGGKSRPPVFLVLAISDYGAACLGAYGVSLGLLARARTGKGRNVETSLLRACMATQSGRYVVVRSGANGAREADYCRRKPRIPALQDLRRMDLFGCEVGEGVGAA